MIRVCCGASDSSPTALEWVSIGGGASWSWVAVVAILKLPGSGRTVAWLGGGGPPSCAGCGLSLGILLTHNL
jgi:hypothetical protein